jgi:hypothetical protein
MLVSIALAAMLHLAADERPPTGAHSPAPVTLTIPAQPAPTRLEMLEYAEGQEAGIGAVDGCLDAQIQRHDTPTVDEIQKGLSACVFETLDTDFFNRFGRARREIIEESR